jgi:hypothetical protein
MKSLTDISTLVSAALASRRDHSFVPTSHNARESCKRLKRAGMLGDDQRFETYKMTRLGEEVVIVMESMVRAQA